MGDADEQERLRTAVGLAGVSSLWKNSNIVDLLLELRNWNFNPEMY